MDDPGTDPRRPGTLWVLNLDWPVPSPVEPRLSATFTRLDSNSAAALAQAMHEPDPNHVLKRFADGRRSYAALVEGQIAAYGWVTFDEEQIGEMQLRLHLQTGEGYIWDCATLEPFRRKRLYTALLRYIADELRRDAFCRVWIGTAHDNTPSQQGVALAGFYPVADLVVDRVLGIRQAWVRAREGAPDSIVADARRAVLGNRELGLASKP